MYHPCEYYFASIYAVRAAPFEWQRKGRLYLLPQVTNLLIIELLDLGAKDQGV